jgi:hypothetical protein
MMLKNSLNGSPQPLLHPSFSAASVGSGPISRAAFVVQSAAEKLERMDS